MNLYEAYGKAQGKQEEEAKKKKKKKPIEINPKGLLKSVSERRKQKSRRF
jgi:hypothetical protein